MSKEVWFGYQFTPEGTNFEAMKNACLVAEKVFSKLK